MRKRILLSMLAVILAFAQVWASPVDSLRINPRTTSLPGNWNGVELSDGNDLLNGLTPGRKGVDLSGITTYSDSWRSLPSTHTFKTKVGQSDSYTFTFDYCFFFLPSIFEIPHTLPWSLNLSLCVPLLVGV